MSKLKTTSTLIMLFILAFNFTTTAQLQAKVKSPPIYDDGVPCRGANPDGTFSILIPLKLMGLTFDDCENGKYSGINNLPCDLHVGLTNLESGETYYTSVNASSYLPVVQDSSVPGNIQDSIIYVDCSDDLSPFEINGYFTYIEFNLPANSEGSARDCDYLGEQGEVQYYGHSIDIFLNFYCLTENGFEPVNFCGPEFGPFIDGVKKCDQSLTYSTTLCCDVSTTNDTPVDTIGGNEFKGNSKNPKAESLDKIQFEFNDASVSIRNLNSTENLGFEIINLNGQLIKRGQIPIGSSMHTILHNAEMTTGIYLIRLYSSEKVITKKFFKS